MSTNTALPAGGFTTDEKRTWNQMVAEKAPVTLRLRAIREIAQHVTSSTAAAVLVEREARLLDEFRTNLSNRDTLHNLRMRLEEQGMLCPYEAARLGRIHDILEARLRGEHE